MSGSEGKSSLWTPWFRLFALQGQMMLPHLSKVARLASIPFRFFRSYLPFSGPLFSCRWFCLLWSQAIRLLGLLVASWWILKFAAYFASLAHLVNYQGCCRHLQVRRLLAFAVAGTQASDQLAPDGLLRSCSQSLEPIDLLWLAFASAAQLLPDFAQLTMSSSFLWASELLGLLSSRLLS